MKCPNCSREVEGIDRMICLVCLREKCELCQIEADTRQECWDDLHQHCIFSGWITVEKELKKKWGIK